MFLVFQRDFGGSCGSGCVCEERWGGEFVGGEGLVGGVVGEGDTVMLPPDMNATLRFFGAIFLPFFCIWGSKEGFGIGIGVWRG